MDTEEKILGTLELPDGETLNVLELRYQNNGNLAIEIIDQDGQCYATLSTNIVGLELAPDEFVVKTWSENQEISYIARQSDLFENTGRRTPDRLFAEIWRLAEK